MTKRHILMLVAAAAVAYVWGYQRGVGVGAAQPAAGPIVGSGTSWLGWQGGAD